MHVNCNFNFWLISMISDVQDFGFITEYFVRAGYGPYWMLKDGLPSLLEGTHALPLILPMEDDD